MYYIGYYFVIKCVHALLRNSVSSVSPNAVNADNQSISVEH